jgi:hypothetical protein
MDTGSVNNLCTFTSVASAFPVFGGELAVAVVVPQEIKGKIGVWRLYQFPIKQNDDE